MPYSALSYLECSRGGARHDADLVQGTCRCGAPLLARYDLDRVAVDPRDIATGRRTCGATTSCCRYASPAGW